VQSALEAARVFSGTNVDWQAQYPDGFIHTFEDGVPMVLVPAGCFMMGSNDGLTDEWPSHEVCFYAPFWIDRTEVTQGHFNQLSGVKASVNRFDGPQRPVESITWFEARDFCARRGARLPTEREWEYAARGPDSLIYPWGDTWNAHNAVWNRNSLQGTANVGSIPGGRSWAGAFDLGGNVWEWVSSLYLPYDSMVDREADTGNRTDISRVLRGGSFVGSMTELRSAYRNQFQPDFVGLNRDNGFRCARSS
jgi:formylglycine-generating enzyme required for sulfatase activity